MTSFLALGCFTKVSLMHIFIFNLPAYAHARWAETERDREREGSEKLPLWGAIMPQSLLLEPLGLGLSHVVGHMGSSCVNHHTVGWPCFYL